MRLSWMFAVLPALVVACGDSGGVMPPEGADCTSCHGFPPQGGRHGLHVGGRDYGCQECHADTVDETNAIANEDAHANGTVDVRLLRGGTWDPAARSCNPACHGSERW